MHKLDTILAEQLESLKISLQEENFNYASTLIKIREKSASATPHGAVFILQDAQRLVEISTKIESINNEISKTKYYLKKSQEGEK